MAKYVLVSCEGELGEFNLETLSKKEQPNVPISIPLGIEFGVVSRCTVYEVEENDGEENKKELGKIVTKIGFDDGKAHFDLKISEELLGHPIVSRILRTF